MFEHFLTALAAHATFDASKEALKRAFAYVQSTRPDLARRAEAAQASGDMNEAEKVFREAVGVIVAEAKTGKIAINQAIITALNGVKFDHQHGQITIGNAVVAAKVLVTGGGATATGTTKIEGNTSLRSAGTRINVGQGAGITITGNAKITQT